MAIDYNAGINSIDVGAHDITYSGNEGPKSPEQKQMMAFDDTPSFELKPLRLLIEEYEADHNGESPTSIDDLRRYFYSKYGPEGIAQVEQAVQQEERQAQMQQREGIQMADAANPMLQDEYDKYVFEMQEMGQEPMSLEDFRQQAVAGMATGGRVGLQAGGPPGVHGRETGGGYSDAERHQAQQQRTAALEASAVPRGKETISPGTGVITRPDGTVDTGGGYIHRPTGIVYDQDYIDKFINVGDKDEKELEKLARKKEKYEASQRRKRTRIENQQRKKLITLLKRRKKQDPDWKGVIPEGWEEDATLDELYGWASTQDWTGKEKYSDLEGRELNEFFEKHGYVPTSKDFPGILGAVYPEKPVTFDEIEQAFQKGKGSLYHKGADDYRVWSPDPDSKEADWLQEMKAFSPMQYANYMGMDWNPVTGEFTKRQDDGYGGVPGAMAAQPVLPVVPEDPEDPTIPGTIATGPITGQLGGIPEANLLDLERIYNTNRAGLAPMFTAADGGRAGYAGGGIADLRQGYFLGKIVKAVTKPFKGITRGIKKIAKSPAGKIAMLAALGYGTGMFGSGQGLAGLRQSLIGSAATGAKAIPGQGGLFKPGTTGWLGKLLLKGGADKWSMANLSPWKSIAGLSALGGLTAMGDDEDEDELYKKWLADKKAADDWWIPKFDQSNFRRITSADGGRIGYRSGLGVLGRPMDPKEEGFNFKDIIIATDEPKGTPIIKKMGEKFIVAVPGYDEMLSFDSEQEAQDYMNILMPFKKDGGRIGYSGGGGYNPGARWSYLIDKLNNNKPMTEDEIKELENLEITYADESKEMAQGGRIGYAGGGYNDDEEEDHRSAALRHLYGLRRGAQEGGLMDLGGMEKDYRNEGGFVPIGGQERADDVPARLSKNEFVFTADAVRNAGGGDIDKGAEIMENLMENLEKGGKVSEESQGLEGARDMFATAQRLEGVL